MPEGLLIVALLSSTVFAQQTTVFAQQSTAPVFEVDTVKRSPPQPIGNISWGVTTSRGHVIMNNVTLKRAVMSAYVVGPNQIFGGPPWLDSISWEIVGKAPTPTDDDSVLMSMLRSLLAERFKLAIHHETRAIQTYVLEVARPGAKL
jgi:uncharacterized protein (TIGR03435 family)